MYTVYILYSESIGKYYIGYTADVEQRLAFHNNGSSRWSKRGIPWRVVYTEAHEDKRSAMRREREIKSYKGNSKFQALVKLK
ncbi:MAG: endonuclease [Ectothiorhodospiraceae bacterium]|nr:endonuclease [Ectothiorhodospiraceae bacterium]